MTLGVASASGEERSGHGRTGTRTVIVALGRWFGAGGTATRTANSWLPSSGPAGVRIKNMETSCMANNRIAKWHRGASSSAPGNHPAVPQFPREKPAVSCFLGRALLPSCHCFLPFHSVVGAYIYTYLYTPVLAGCDGHEHASRVRRCCRHSVGGTARTTGFATTSRRDTSCADL